MSPENKYLISAFYSELSNVPIKNCSLDSMKISHVPTNNSFKFNSIFSAMQDCPLDAQPEIFNTFFSSETSNPLKDLKKLEVAFGDQNFHQVYYDKANELKKIDTLASDNLEQFLGFNSLIPEGNNANFPKKDKINEDPFDHNFGNEDDKENFSSLQIYWRFDEGKGSVINDLSDLENNGILECENDFDNEEVWNMLDDGDPMEFEDKWGKKCPTQYSVDLFHINIKNSKPNWLEDSEPKQFTLELWLKPRTKNGVILQISNDNFVTMIQECFLKIAIKGKILVFQEDEIPKDENNNEEDNPHGNQKNKDEIKKIKENFWNHLAIVYDSSQNKTLIIYLNCFEIGYSNIHLENDIFKEKLLMLERGNLMGKSPNLDYGKMQIPFQK